MGYSEYDGHSKSVWNVGRKVGPKRALKLSEVWAIRFCLESPASILETVPCSISRSTASCGASTWFVSAPAIWRAVMPSESALRSSSERRNDLSSSRSSSQEGRHCPRGVARGAAATAPGRLLSHLRRTAAHEPTRRSQTNWNDAEVSQNDTPRGGQRRVNLQLGLI